MDCFPIIDLHEVSNEKALKSCSSQLPHKGQKLSSLGISQ